MVGDAAGGHAKRRVDDPVNPACQPAAGRTGHNKRADDAAPRGKHEQGADNRDHRAGSKRHHHGISSRQSMAMTNLPRSVRASHGRDVRLLREGSSGQHTGQVGAGPGRASARKPKNKLSEPERPDLPDERVLPPASAFTGDRVRTEGEVVHARASMGRGENPVGAAESVNTCTGDGRLLEALVSGPSAGTVLVLHTGTPCGLVPLPAGLDPAPMGLRTILAGRATAAPRLNLGALSLTRLAIPQPSWTRWVLISSSTWAGQGAALTRSPAML